MATIAAITQFLASDVNDSNVALGVAYAIYDSDQQRTRQFSIYDIPGLTLVNLLDWKSIIVQAVINHAATEGFVLPAANLNWIPYEGGNQRLTKLVFRSSHEHTFNLNDTNKVNIHQGLDGEPQIVDFTRYRQYRLLVYLDKNSGDGVVYTLTDINNISNNFSATYSGPTGEIMLDSGWVNLPTWAFGEKLLACQIGTTDPITVLVYHQSLLYLR